jgi:hypothetical protein
MLGEFHYTKCKNGTKNAKGQAEWHLTLQINVGEK